MEEEEIFLGEFFEDGLYVEKKIRKRGNKWVVVHCHGNGKETVIGTHPTRAAALAQHQAIQVSQAKERKPKKKEDESPLKEPDFGRSTFGGSRGIETVFQLRDRFTESEPEENKDGPEEQPVPDIPPLF